MTKSVSVTARQFARLVGFALKGMKRRDSEIRFYGKRKGSRPSEIAMERAALSQERETFVALLSADTVKIQN